MNARVFLRVYKLVVFRRYRHPKETKKPNNRVLLRALLFGCIGDSRKSVSNKFFGKRDFPYLRLGIRDFKGKSGRDLGLKVCTGGGMPKVTLGITGLPENLGRDYGIEKPYWGPSSN